MDTHIPSYLLITDRLKTFNSFKNKQKSVVWSNVFWYVNVYILPKFIQYIIEWNRKQMLKKIS